MCGWRYTGRETYKQRVSYAERNGRTLTTFEDKPTALSDLAKEASETDGNASDVHSAWDRSMKWYRRKDEQIRDLEQIVELLSRAMGLMLSGEEVRVDLDAVIKYSAKGKDVERYLREARTLWIQSRGVNSD